MDENDRNEVIIEKIVKVKEQDPQKLKNIGKEVLPTYGREPWSSGCGTRPMSWRSWVRIPAPYTGWTFFTFICCKIVMFVWKDENKQKEAGFGPF